MKLCHILESLVSIAILMLTNQFTCLCFNNYISDRMPIDNGTMQGHPALICFYSIFNAPLMMVARSKDELSPGFIDDSIMLVTGPTLSDCHGKLKDMMERPEGSFDWSISHNSPFEMFKVALMNWPRTYRDIVLSDLVLDRPNSNSTTTPNTIKTVSSYKYLGVMFDPGFCWTLQHAKVTANATFWSSCLWRLVKIAKGMGVNGL